MKFILSREIIFVVFLASTLYGLFLKYMLLPYSGLSLFHCVISAWLFGLLNCYLYYRFSRKHLSLKSSLNQLNEKLLKDALTGLLNRRAFEEDLMSFRDSEPYSIIFLDIDNFRSFNNTYGHQAGDFVLRRVSSTIQTNTRCLDKIYRYGGEELVVLLENCAKKDALAVAEQIRLAVMAIDNSPYPGITVSLGVSSSPEDGNVLNEIVQNADQMMLQAKVNGKNCTYTFSMNSVIS